LLTEGGDMTTYHVGYLVGSLAKAFINRLPAKALMRLAPPEVKFHEISFKDLPLYSYDYDAAVAAAVRRARTRLMLLLSMAVTANVQPFQRTVSPGTGIRPNSANIIPPTV
jgi:hypothetical protein